MPSKKASVQETKKEETKTKRIKKNTENVDNIPEAKTTNEPKKRGRKKLSTNENNIVIVEKIPNKEESPKKSKTSSKKWVIKKTTKKENNLKIEETVDSEEKVVKKERKTRKWKSTSIVCCKEFVNQKKFDWKTLKWKNKKFVKADVFSILNIPFGLAKKVTEMMKKIKRAKAINEANEDDMLMLFNNTKTFKTSIYISVDSEVKTLENIAVSWTFASKVYEWWYNDTWKNITKMKEYLNEKWLEAIDFYIHYTYCPKCAKKYWKNYTIIFAHLD